MESFPIPKLIIEQGPTPGQEIELAKDEFVIGRIEGNDLVIAEPSVSRRHARLLRQGEQVLLEDLGSSNGTFVNGQRLSAPFPLKSGDIFTLGQATRLKFQAPPPPIMEHQARTMVSDRPAGLPAAPNKTVGISKHRTPGMTIAQTDLAPGSEGQAPQVLITVTGEAPQAYMLQGEHVTIGRAPDNDIVISSKIVSGNHAVLDWYTGVYYFTPLPDVTNPVYYDGKPLTGAVALKSGSLLRIGGQDPGLMVTVEYSIPGGYQEAPPIQFNEKNQVHIGRDLNNDLALPSPTVSRYHAIVERVGQRYRVRDLDSSNGTYVNDLRITGETWLKAGDSIRIGPYRFVVGEDQLAQVQEASGMRVEVLGLNKWVRKNLNLLKDISLVFQPREFIVVVGQSGGGKSTLVDAIAGFRPATHGRVLINDIDIYRNFDAIRNEIGLVPQRDIIHMELTVTQALDYAAKLRMPADTTAEERHTRVAEVLQDLDLTHRQDVQISGLSGGQQKRVSIGVELLTKPGLFFLDEPTSGLDPGTETALMHLMRRLADQGRTIVLITHATKNVMLADKVVFLARGGFLAWFGPPNEALAYFDQFRSDRDRHAGSMEFDEIYAILDDPNQGSAEDWAHRFHAHPAYQEYIVSPLQALGRNLPGTALRKEISQGLAKPAARPHRNQVSGLRQFFILSARNIKILTRDRPSLVLMLISAPLVAMIMLLMSSIFTRNLFSFQTGNMKFVISSVFQPVIFSVMVGALSQMREFVKESEVYRRERLVNLKVLPYVISKVWVALLLALYQAVCYVGLQYLAFNMPGGIQEFLIIYFSLVLSTLAGMMLGLFASAVSPNANAAPLIVIMLIIPQVVLGGGLIPVPPKISQVTITRWAFESVLATTGAASDVAADVCWALPESVRNNMSLDDKAAHGCKCMGISALHEQTCNFPGLGKNYKPAIDQPAPVEPPSLGEPPPEPVLPDPPAKPADPNDQVALAQYLQALNDYQAKTDKIRADYKLQVNDYQARSDLYKAEMTDYQTKRTQWEVDRNAAVSKAEGIINVFNTDFGWAFVNKNDRTEYWSRILFAWGIDAGMVFILFVITLVFIYRKDRLK